MKTRHLLVVAAMGGLVAACSPDTDKASNPTENFPTDTETGEPAIPSPATTMAFIDQMAASDLFQIEAGKLAQQMGMSQEVKAFAAAMVKEHTASSAKLKSVAEKAQPAIIAAPKLIEEQQLELDRLRKAGANFDSAYARMQVTAHEDALRALRGYAAAGENAALRDFAAGAIESMERHFEQAKQLPSAQVAVDERPVSLAGSGGSH